MLDLARRCVFFLSHNEGESSGGATRSYHDFCPSYRCSTSLIEAPRRSPTRPFRVIWFTTGHRPPAPPFPDGRGRKLTMHPSFP